MLPGFTSPLGSRKERLSLVTVCCLSASAKGALFGTLCVPVGAAVPFACAADAVLASLVRTKSAQDFGAAGLGGDVGTSAGAVSVVPLTAAVSAWTGAASAAATGGCCVCFSVDVGVPFAFGSPPMFGTAIAVRVSLRACCCAGAPDGLGEDAAAWAGVVGVETCAKSLSEGA
jgi:hypothetical protein